MKDVWKEPQTNLGFKQVNKKKIIITLIVAVIVVLLIILVGTYYSSATPNGTPYVTVGSKVKKGDTLCIIEAMKVMNEVASEYDGEVMAVFKKDEDIVEYGMDLFKIKEI